MDRIEKVLRQAGLTAEGNCWIERAIEQKAKNMTLGIMITGAVTLDEVDSTMGTVRYYYNLENVYPGVRN